MKRCLVKFSLIAWGALMVTHAFAQSAGKASSANAKRMQTAAGSVIVLADGIVANTTVAQIPPPADGFVYER